MSSIEDIFKLMDKPLKPSVRKERMKDRVIKKLNESLDLVKAMSDVDDLNYGSPSKKYLNKKGKEVGGKNVCWGNSGFNGKRSVRMIIGNAIVEFNGTKASLNVDDSLKGVIGGIETLIKHAQTISVEDWEDCWNQMLSIRKKKSKTND
jgi:hypothetical protein